MLKPIMPMEYRHCSENGCDRGILRFYKEDNHIDRDIFLCACGATYTWDGMKTERVDFENVSIAEKNRSG